MTISIIVAAANNNCIGKLNKLPWHLKADLQYFKKLTTGNCIIMGKNTFESIGKPLPNRVNIVLTTDKNYTQNGVVVRNTLQDALDYCNRWNQQEVFIIGGGKVYEQAIPLANKLYFTKVNTEVENGDTFFPAIDNKTWAIHNATAHTKDADNDFDYTFETYLKSNSEPIIYK